jgi:hypothetical protein
LRISKENGLSRGTTEAILSYLCRAARHNSNKPPERNSFPAIFIQQLILQPLAVHPASRPDLPGPPLGQIVFVRKRTLACWHRPSGACAAASIAKQLRGDSGGVNMNKPNPGFDYDRYRKLLAEANDEPKRVALIELLVVDGARAKLAAQRLRVGGERISGLPNKQPG